MNSLETFVWRRRQQVLWFSRKVQDSPTCEKCNSDEPAALEDPAAAVYCLDCGEFLCNDCEFEHQKLKDFQSYNRIALTDLSEHDLGTLCPPVRISCFEASYSRLDRIIVFHVQINLPAPNVNSIMHYGTHSLYSLDGGLTIAEIRLAN